MNLENRKQLAVLLLAVGFGLVAALLTGHHVQQSIKQQTEFLAKEYEQRNAVLINEIDGVRAELKKVEQQQRLLAQKQQQQQSGEGPAGQPAAPQPSFAFKTPPGKRAYTIKIDSLSAVGGLVNPGDSVDVIAQLKIPQEEKSTDKDKKKKPEDVEVTTVLFQDVLVLAVGPNFRAVATAEAYETRHKALQLSITLALSPEEAALMTFAQDNGSMRLSLRSPSDEERPSLQVASWDTLSDYVKEKQGTTFMVPKKAPEIENFQPIPPPIEGEGPKPYIQIFRGGREL